jgi:PAS domain S-box-containing protein
MGNRDLFSHASATYGHLILGRDSDHAIRWMPLVIQGGKDFFPPLALWCAWHYLDKPPLLLRAERYGVEGIQMGQRFIPTDSKGQLLIDYLGPPKTFPHVSISDILSDRFPAGTFTNKIVIIGATAMGIHDLLAAPLNPNYAAVEIHATVIDNILNQDFLTRPAWATTYDLFAIIMIGGLMGIALPRLGVRRGLWMALGLATVHIIVVCWMFVYAGVWVTAVYPLVVLAANYIGLSFNQMVRQLRQREFQYRDLVEGSLQGISIVTKDGTRIFANSALARLWGYESPDELIGRSLWENIAPHERSPLQASLNRQMQGTATPAYRPYQTVKKDGTLIWTERLASPMRSHGETVILEAYIDVTERYRLEAQLHQAQKTQAIGTLAGGISHDFNNLLTAILGYTGLARQELSPNQAAGPYLDEVLAAGTRAKDLVQQILAFSRQTEIQRAPVPLQPLIQEVLGLLRAALPASIVIRPVLAPGVGQVLADATQMHQVLLNLCTNAAHAMRETGGVIDVILDAVEVTPDHALVPLQLQAGPYVRLRVRDTGQGMTPDVMERIFEPFFTTKPTGEGTGLGLAVVHGIVRRHEGAITVESTPARGTTFTIHLPQVADAANADVPTEPQDVGGSEHILVVDDEEVLVYLGQGMLASLGYQVTRCSGSLEALDVFQASPHHFDLVITDYTMPDMDGVALARALRQSRPDMPIILCTGFSDIHTAESAQALGITVVLKPWTISDLDLKIRQTLAQRPAEGR